jgi:hypothetical protein
MNFVLQRDKYVVQLLPAFVQIILNKIVENKLLIYLIFGIRSLKCTGYVGCIAGKVCTLKGMRAV